MTSSAALSHAPRTPSRTRPLLLTLLALLALVVLAGCGGSVATTLIIGDDGSGKRAMDITVSKDDLEEVEGGTERIEEVIEAHIPDGLSYDGSSKGSEGARVFSFEIPFDDIDTYRSGVVDILAAGDVVDREVEISHVTEQPPFTSGVEYSENFDSLDLMQWLVQAMVDEQLVDESDRGNVLESGKTVLEIEGTKHETSATIGYGEVESFGFSAVEVTTDGIGSDAFTRTITYELSAETYARDREGYDAFFEEATPEGGELATPADAGTTWTITFPEATAEDLVEMTNTALRSEQSQFAVSTEPSDEDPMTSVTSIMDHNECAQICQPDVPVGASVLVPTTWGTGEEETDGRSLVRLGGGAEPESISHPVELSGGTASLTLGKDGGGSFDFAVTTTPEVDEESGEAIADWLAGDGPQPGRGTADGRVTYTVHIEGEDAESLSTAMSEAGFTGMNGGPPMLAVERNGSDGLDAVYDLTVDVSLPDRMYDVAADLPVTWNVRADDGLEVSTISADGDLTPRVEDGTASVTAPGGNAVLLQVGATQSNLPLILTLGAVLLGSLALIGVGIFLVLRLRRTRA